MYYTDRLNCSDCSDKLGYIVCSDKLGCLNCPNCSNCPNLSGDNLGLRWKGFRKFQRGLRQALLLPVRPFIRHQKPVTPVTPAPVMSTPITQALPVTKKCWKIPPPKPVTPTPRPVTPAPVVSVQKIVDTAIKTPVSEQAKAKTPIIAGKVKKVLPAKNETINLISPLVAEKLQAKGIMPEDATKEDVKDVLVEVSRESGFLGLPWYVPLAGAGLIGLILIKRKR